jgi:ATP-dependent Clp protease ATP-binding subunit ClpB
MVRLDMSEYQERHTVSRLVGAPPGYVGYEEGGQLTEAVRRKPYSVVLLDEIEKAHADVFNTLLQILDDGRLTDAQGTTVDFRNCVVIMTSNIGSVQLLDGVTDEGEIGEQARDRVMAELRGHFRPEFLNRVDDIVLFKPLTLEEIEQIVDLQVANLRHRLADRLLELELTEPARALIARAGYDPVYGARPLRRFIQHEVETKIGRGHLAGGILTAAEVPRALESRPGWHWRNNGLVRALQFRDFGSAHRFAEQLADSATYYGQRPDIAIRDDGRVVLSLVNHNHAGVTVADLALADMIDRAIEQHSPDGTVRDARA